MIRGSGGGVGDDHVVGERPVLFHEEDVARPVHLNCAKLDWIRSVLGLVQLNKLIEICFPSITIYNDSNDD